MSTKELIQAVEQINWAAIQAMIEKADQFDLEDKKTDAAREASLPV